MRVDHVAIAVNDIDEALRNYEKILRIDRVEVESVYSEKVKVAILNLEDTRLELIQPVSDDSPIKKFLALKGEGMHHIAITADNIETDVSRAIANGKKLLGDLHKGSYGRRITFIHPRSMNGVLTEFCEAVLR